MNSQMSETHGEQGEQGSPSSSHMHINQQADEQLSKTGTKRRRFLNLLKKQDSGSSDGQRQTETKPTSAPSALDNSSSKRVLSPTSAPMQSPSQPLTPTSNPRDEAMSQRNPLSASTSPSRLPMRSSSPLLLSPASSLIFERNVQEKAIPDDLSAAIPTHIQTEDHIPAVLEASSIAITDGHLDPSDVEIVTHTAHLPAALPVAAGTSHSDQPLSPALSVQQHYEPSEHGLDDSAMGSAQSYGDIDTTDVRRLSFISFADVVQSENLETGTASMSASYIFPMSPASPIRNRSPSPMRSPGSSSSIQQTLGNSASSSIKGIPIGRSPPVPLSPDGMGLGALSASPAGGDLVMKKMSAALRAAETAELHENNGTRKGSNGGSLESSLAHLQ